MPDVHAQSGRRRRRTGLVPTLVAAAAVLLASSGCAPADGIAVGAGAPGTAEPLSSVAGRPDASTSASVAPPQDPPSVTASAGSSRTPVPVRPATDAPPTRTAAPVRLVYPAIGTDMEVVPTGVLADGGMELPDDPDVAGWYRHGPAPGDAAGSAVIASHSGSPRNPVGRLYALRESEVGDELTVVDAEGVERRHVVTSVAAFGKAGLDFTPHFRRTGDPVLTLITCGGEWDEATGHYTDNIVVTATPVAD
ncbi:class F sortase [Micrococcus flavus]|uniref:Uncharacterized protein n=1 Tax=Micrococcus flavus TaxID=384602 RepID=A0A4Y8WWD2_9MICC|nr:class F sortase [Micrococcus flavus]MBB4883584.1 hypothetical protein [Micrococcus flavus]TFH99539.1 class F sortase [Micrococcus flavus]GGK54649.1 class F sortase [Micrococcus flavus]